MKLELKTDYLFMIIVILVGFLTIGYGAYSEVLKIDGNASVLSTSDFVYEYLPYNQSINITSYVGSSQSVTIPSLLDNYPVKIIDKYAFKDKNLTNIIIPQGVEKLNLNAFSNNKLEQLIIPDSIKEIGNQVFENNNLMIVSFKSDIPPTFGQKVFDLNYHLVNICIPYTADENIWKNALAQAGVNTNPNMLVNPIANLIRGRAGACAEIGTGDVVGPPAIQCGTNAYQLGDKCVCFDQYEGDPYVMCSLKLELTCFTFQYQAWSKYNVIKSFNCDTKSVRIPDLVDGVHTGKINKDVFSSKGLTEVILNDYLRIIDMYAFRYNNLRTVTISENVNSIVLNAFSHNVLETVIFKSLVPPKMDTNCFTENPNLKKICVPSGTSAAYTKAIEKSGIPADAVIYENDAACKLAI